MSKRSAKKKPVKEFILSLAIVALVVATPLAIVLSQKDANKQSHAQTQANTSILEGSFVQPWVVEGWTASNFATEFQYMKNVKMDHVIWQWTVDSLPSRKWTYYPTSMTGFTQHTGTDVVGLSLEQAKLKGIKVWLGLNWTDDWWSKSANDQAWLTNEFSISKNTAQELWNRYGTEYSDTIAGFYITMEVDNFNFGTTVTQDRMITVYKDTTDYIHATTGKPVMVAPFFNETGGQDANTYADFWGRIITQAPIDVVAVQDGIGVNHASVSTIGSWLSTLRTAIKTARPTTELWSDLETFTETGGNFVPAPVSRIIDQLNAEKAYVDKFTTFSFNHYDSPQQGHTTEYNAWKAYADTVDTASPTPTVIPTTAVISTTAPTSAPAPTATPTQIPTATPTPQQTTNLLKNGSFDTGTSLSPWFFESILPAKGTASRNSTNKIEGQYSAKISITTRNNNAYYIQLGQGGVELTAGGSYTISFWAKANKNRTGQVAVQLDKSPWTLYLIKDFALTTSWKQFTYTFTAPATGTSFVAFNMAQTTGSVFLDKVILK